jgi:GR25 family glycosyltransferase involved in LPS biosynthesis
MENIDNVYVINLDSSTERLEQMNKQMNILGKPFTRVSAVNGKTLSNEEINNVTNLACRYFCTNTMIGIFLSHKKVWQTIIENNDKYALVMEDDCVLVDTFQTDLKNSLNELDEIDPEWDFLYLGCFGACSSDRNYDMIVKIQMFGVPKINKTCPCSCKKQDCKLCYHRHKYTFIPEAPTGFHCYIISNKCAKRMVDLIDKVTYHVDVEFLNHAYKFNIYASS